MNYSEDKIDTKYYDALNYGDVHKEKFLTKEEFENGEQGIVGLKMSTDEIVFADDKRIKISSVPPK